MVVKAMRFVLNMYVSPFHVRQVVQFNHVQSI